MPEPLLTTKLYIPPVRPGFVSRPRLVERLNAGLSRQLVLVSAPAGFGKTTLLSEWIAGLSLTTGPSSCPSPCVAWVSLDDGDNDPARFLAYLAGALQQVDQAIGRSLQGLMQSLSLSPAAPGGRAEAAWVEAPMATLVNDLARVDASLVLVLDDYHLIHNDLVHQAVRFLVDHQPPHVHLVISTREDPPLPLPRLRARGQVVEIRERDLRFTVEEAAAFLERTMGLHLSPTAVATLEARTEGWITGLQLAALSLENRADGDAFVAAFAGDDRHVVDYLAQEVLHRQPEAIQAFMLQTAILDRLSGPLCDAVVDREQGTGGVEGGSQGLLEHLERANLFLVPLDNRREWYRYHRLFADLLRYRLRQVWPQRLPELHRRASRWYERAGDADGAIHHALAIPDSSLAAHLAEQYGVRMVGGSRLATYLGWIEHIPDELIYARPYLCAGCGWAFVLTGQVEAAGRYVQAGEEALGAFEPLYVGPEQRLVTRDEVRGHLTAIRAYSARLRGDVDAVVEYSQQALAQLPGEAFTVRCVVALNLGFLYTDRGEIDQALVAFAEAAEMGRRSGENLYAAIAALSMQGEILASRGRLQEAAELYRQAIDLGGAGGGGPVPIPAAGMGHLGLAGVHYQRHELAAAAEQLEQVLASAAQFGHGEALREVYLFDARLASSAGDPERAEASLERARAFAQADQSASYRSTNWVMAHGEFLLARHDVDGAAQWAAAHGLSAQDVLSLPLEEAQAHVARLPEYVLLARVLLAQSRLDEALGLLEWLEATAEASRHVTALVEAVVLRALAWHLKGDDGRALACLERALALAAPQAYVRPFAVAGEPLIGLLRQAAARGTATEYAGKLLAALKGPARGRGAAPLAHPHPQPLIEPLSERELEVLRLIAAGLSNQEIAQTLVVAVSTVKSHVNHILGKLGAKSRTQALVQARELGLL